MHLGDGASPLYWPRVYYCNRTRLYFTAVRLLPANRLQKVIPVIVWAWPIALGVTS